MLAAAKASLESRGQPIVLTFHRFRDDHKEDAGLTDSDFDIDTPGKTRSPRDVASAPKQRGRRRAAKPAPPPPAAAPSNNHVDVETTFMSPELLRRVDRSQYDAYIQRLRRTDGPGPSTGAPGEATDKPGLPPEEQPGYGARAAETVGPAVVEGSFTPGIPTFSETLRLSVSVLVW
jgi:hypothetical protein